MRALYDLLQPSRLTSIVDIGANPIDAPPVYTRMLEEGLCTVAAIDPQGPEIAHPSVRTLRHIVGDGTEQTIYVAQSQGMTSLLPISKVRAGLFPKMLEWGEAKYRSPAKTVRFDDIDDIVEVDFLKMDIQGSEKDVLTYGRRKLANAVMIVTEMSFVPLYQGQWCFGRMDTELRQMGFLPHCFAEAKVWPIATDHPIPQTDPHQLLECDMVYVRDITLMHSAEQWKHMALAAHHICGSFDLAMRAIGELAKMEAVSPSAPEQYRQMLERM